MSEEKSIVVLTNTRDLAADDVIQRLARNHNVVRINADKDVMGPLWDLENDIHSVGAVWWRQFERWPQSPLNVDSIDDLLITRAQWRSWFSILDDGKIPWINPVWSARRAENKIEQLRLAKSCRFLIPETIVTNQLQEARQFSEAGPAVLKSLAAAYFEFSGDGFVYTRSLQDALDFPVSDWLNQPFIIQRQVFGDDVRVIVFDELAFGAICTSNGTDWRVSQDKTEWKIWDTPPELLEKCLRYMDGFGLRYAAFDFIEGGGKQWFLEANQAGEWVFLDRPLQMGIADELTKFLSRLSKGHAK